MKLIHYTCAAAKVFDDEQARGVTGRVLIGKLDGTSHFCMRSFEIKPGGHTPRHAHAWEHEIFFHSGEAQVYINGELLSAGPGTALYVAPDEEHQIRNAGKETLIVVCLIPAGAPEL